MLQIKSRFFVLIFYFLEGIIKHLLANHCIEYIAKPSLYTEESYYPHRSQLPNKMLMSSSLEGPRSALPTFLKTKEQHMQALTPNTFDKGDGQVHRYARP